MQNLVDTIAYGKHPVILAHSGPSSKEAGFNFETLDLGLVDYNETLSFQKKLAKDVADGIRQSTLILCEHNPVITLGRQARKENILKSEAELRAAGIKTINTNRGGDATFHLPGQLIVYPVFDLRRLGRDIHSFLRNLEAALILLLEDYGISACRQEGLTGVWVSARKIASIGIAISHWVTTHGISLNVSCDLDFFSLIRPCGLDIMMTSMAELKEMDSLKMEKVKEKAIENFQQVFSSGG
jgi:lipoate-protein ligase B